MRNIKLTIRYDGTNYAGWQSQKNGRAIQDVIEDAIASVTGARSRLTGSGRTDAGVHALAQTANFRTRSRIPLKNLRMALNTRLPRDIVICAAEEAGPKFDAQRSAKSKLYRYTIMNSDILDPFVRRYAAKCFHALDVDLMKRASRAIAGRHDFRSFRAADPAGDGAGKSSVRTVRRISVGREGDMIYIDIEADGFLYNMARNIAGTLVEIGRGKFAPGSMTEILRKRDRRHCGPTMPARGLCLVKVNY